MLGNLPTGGETSRRNYSKRNYGLIVVKMEFEEEPCRRRDEETEEGWCFPSFSLITDKKHSDKK